MMNAAEVFLLFGSGYVCGLSTASGFVLSALMQIYVTGKSGWRMLVWALYMVANTTIAALIPIFLIGVIVVADKPEREDFWIRALFFCTGLGVGVIFILVSAYFINIHLRKLIPSKEQPKGDGEN